MSPQISQITQIKSFSIQRSAFSMFLIALCLFASVANAFAESATVAPAADSSTGSWTTTPLWSKVNEDIDSPNATVIVSGNNPGTPSNDVVFTVTCPGDLATITEANLRIRAREQGNSGRSISFAVSWSASGSTNFNTGNLTSSLANYASGNQTGLSVSKSTCDASTISVAPTTTGSGPGEKAEIDAFNLDIVYTVASGPATVPRRIQLGLAGAGLVAAMSRPAGIQ